MKWCIFSIPTSLSSEAVFLISEIMQEDQHNRPTAEQCFQLEFLQGFIVPKSLPAYCLLREPRAEDIPFDEGSYMAFLLQL